MGVRIGCHCLVKGVKNQGVVVGIPDDEGYDAPVIEIQNGAEIDLVFLRSNVILILVLPRASVPLGMSGYDLPA